MWGNLEILFLSWVIFNNVFSHEKTGYNSAKNKTSPKWNINRKKASQSFFPTPLIFKLQQEVYKSNIYVSWSLPKAYKHPSKEKFKTDHLTDSKCGLEQRISLPFELRQRG